MKPSFTITDTNDIYKTCRCGQEFLPFVAAQTYCTRACQHRYSNHVARATARAQHETTFIGVDGEGINVKNTDGTETHRYVMLSVGSETLWNDGQELTHHDIFPFLYDQFLVNPAAAFVGFFLGYDFTMWLKSLPEDRAQILFNPAKRQRTKSGKNPVPFPVYIDDWEIDILGLKRFKIRPHVDGKKKPPWMYINDAGSFFQKSFVNVIEPTDKKWPTGAPCTAGEFETIISGKNKRSNIIDNGDNSYFPDMRKYNILENDILSRTMTILNKGFVQAGIKLKRDQYYGPGQVAQQWLRQQNDKNGVILDRKTLETILPPWVVEAARESYYGGWFEILYHGHISGPSNEYDITSAYPHIMRNLPCLCGTWTLQHVKSEESWQLVYGTAIGTNPHLGSLPFRNPRGNILRPPMTRGWYWQHEIDAAQRAGILTTFIGEQWIVYHPCSHNKPLAGLAELFQQRLRVGKSTPHGIGLKLTYNSAYGKFAQSIGTPVFANPVYASLITAGVRAIICDAIATHPNHTDDLLMIATDAVYFRTPHPSLDMTPDTLGSWEHTEKHNLTLMKPGVYWDDSTRDAIKNGWEVTLKSRGISARSLAENIDKIDDMFNTLTTDLTQPWPEIAINVPFTVTSPRLALARGKWDTCGQVTYNVARVDKATPAPKRTAPYLEDGIIRSRPMNIPLDCIDTTPYAKRFGFPIPDIDSDTFTQDGSLSDTASWVKEL